ncbi:hypothetical protein H0H87_012242 [Tephrocybe sp. NHM501043]|nr:hypothetical protein H0H87_012242 [Tephrocybe sp. NHM501043]
MSGGGCGADIGTNLRRVMPEGTRSEEDWRVARNWGAAEKPKERSYEVWEKPRISRSRTPFKEHLMVAVPLPVALNSHCERVMRDSAEIIFFASGWIMTMVRSTNCQALEYAFLTWFPPGLEHLSVALEPCFTT